MITAELSGGKRLASAFAALPSGLKKSELNTVVRAAARVSRASLRTATPQGATGALRKDQTSTGVQVVKSSGPGASVFRVGFSELAFIARFLEHGTIHMRARPFILESFESSRIRAMRVLSDGLRRVIVNKARAISGRERRTRRGRR